MHRLRRYLTSRTRAKVFCVGFQKTGTTSMRSALEVLGYRVAGHFGVDDPEIRHNALPQALKLAGKYGAFQDNPWPVLFRELDAHFPGSRFVLTVRDPQRWMASVVSHFGDLSTPMREWIYEGHGAPRGNEAAYLKRYERHNREVREYFSARTGDLLEMDIEAGDGWDALCGFLGFPVPDVPFPHKNRAEGRLPAQGLSTDGA
jgi:hypothetical protein